MSSFQLAIPILTNPAVVPSPTRPKPAPSPSLIQLREAAHQYLPAIKDLPAAEQPINRLNHYGPRALATAELLAVILATPHGITDAEHLLGAFEGLPGLATATLHELQSRPGIGQATAARIQAALELGRRLLVAAPADRPRVSSPAEVANLLMAEMSLLPQEHLRTVLLDTRNRVISIPTVYVGSLNTAVIRVGEIFRQAIRANAAALIVVHNHPSGDPQPSPEDGQVTRMIAAAGDLMGIDVLDHIVLGQQRFVSLKERGLGFS